MMYTPISIFQHLHLEVLAERFLVVVVAVVVLLFFCLFVFQRTMLEEVCISIFPTSMFCDFMQCQFISVNAVLILIFFFFLSSPIGELLDLTLKIFVRVSASAFESVFASASACHLVFPDDNS